MVFITAGLGGGTGSGAAPVIAEIAKEAGRADHRRRDQAVQLRGRRRKLVAEKAAEELKAKVDTLITIPNDRLATSSRRTPASSTPSASSTTCCARASRASATSSRCPGLINLDFADVRAIMKDAGSALMGIGRATGENRAVEAARQAIASPLLEVNITGAQGILFNITGSSNLSLFEVTEAAEEIRAAADPEANIIFGTSFNERLGDEVMITVIATGFDGGRKRHDRPPRGRPASWTRAATGRPSRERDFLEELQRQRDEIRRRRPTPATGAAPTSAAAAVVAAPRVERSVGEPAPAKRAADLRRGRPGDPELPPPEVSRRW